MKTPRQVYNEAKAMALDVLKADEHPLLPSVEDVERFLKLYLDPAFDQTEGDSAVDVNHVGALMEDAASKNYPVRFEYRRVSDGTDPDHVQWMCIATVNGRSFTATGRTKKAAKKEACRLAIAEAPR